MTEKYYTPTIEEFHVGFEYESFEKSFREGDEWDIGTDMWVKRTVLDINQPMVGFEKNYKAIYHVSINNSYEKNVTWNKNIRVKCLDKKDIEFCGWVYRNTNGMRHWYDGKSDWFGREIPSSPSGRYWGYDLVHDPKLNIIIISAKTNSGDDTKDCFFEGLCKNKSELVRLMKQLNIV